MKIIIGSAIFFTINAFIGLMLHGFYIREMGVLFGIMYVSAVFGNKMLLEFIYNYGKSDFARSRW